MSVEWTEARADQLQALLDAALADLRVKLEAEGEKVGAIGLSMFLVAPESELNATLQLSSFAGDLAAIGEFAPEWPYQLTADLVGEPAEAFERRYAGSVN